MTRGINFFLGVVIVLLMLAHAFPLLTPVWGSKEAFQIDLARNLSRENLNIFKGKISNIPYYLNVPEEVTPPYDWTEDFPLFHVLVAGLMKLFGNTTHWVGRILSLFFFLWGSYFLWRFSMNEYGKETAVWALFFWSSAPIVMAFSTSFMADMAMVASFLGALFYLQSYFRSQQRKMYFFLSLLFAMAMPAFRYYGVFLFFPLLGYWVSHDRKVTLKWLFYFMLPVLIPFGWLYYSLHFVANPINLHASHENWHWGFWKLYLVDSFFYYEIIFDRLSRYSLTYVGFVFLVIGIFKHRKNLFILGSLAAIILSFGIFNIGHHINEYYELKFMPLISLMAALGVVYGVGFIKSQKVYVSLNMVLVFGIFVLSISQGYKLLRYDSSGKKLGLELKKYIEPADLVMSIQDVPDSSIFTYADTQGWIDETKFLREKRKVRENADFLVIRVQNEPEDLKFILDQGFQPLWSFKGDIGMHTKCGAFHFFKGTCRRNPSYLYIFKRAVFTAEKTLSGEMACKHTLFLQSVFR